MDIAMEPEIAFRVSAHAAPALEVRVNFGVYTGRNATAAEIDDLARALRADVASFTVIAEGRHEFGNDIETAVHQVVIEVEGENGDGPSGETADRVVATASRWAAACIASRSELGELSES
jgi:hypothetical protein